MGGCVSTSTVDKSVKIEDTPVADEQIDWKKIHSMVRWNKPIEEIRPELKTVSYVNCQDKDNGNYPIHIACQNGHFEICKLLTTLGANLDAKNKKGNTALHMAISYDYYDCAKQLIDSGASKTIQNDDGHKAINGIEGNKSFALLMVSISKSTEEIEKSFQFCVMNTSEFDKASFASAGLKLKKSVGPKIWNDDIQAQFKAILDSFQ